MAVCQYFGQSGCSAPVFGGGSFRSDQVVDFPLNLLSFIFGSSPLAWLLSIVLYGLIIRFLIWPLIIVPFIDWLDFRAQAQRPGVILELRPLQSSLEAMPPMESLLRLLQQRLILSPSSVSWIGSKRRLSISLEIVSTRQQGIRYLLRLPASLQNSVEQLLSAYAPTISFQITKDYLDQAVFGSAYRSITEFKQTTAWLYPLKEFEPAHNSDHMAYIAGAMVRPKKQELSALQIVLSPYPAAETLKWRRRVLAGATPSPNYRPTTGLIQPIVWSLRSSLWLVKKLIQITEFSFNVAGYSQSSYARSSERHFSSVQQPADQAILAKLSQTLFYVDIRTYLTSETREDLNRRSNDLSSALMAYGNNGYQQLAPLASSWLVWVNQLAQKIKIIGSADESLLYKYRYRLPSRIKKHSAVLSAPELAGIYHFPSSVASRTENTISSLSRQLPAPAAMKRLADRQGFDVILGRSHYHGAFTDIGLTADERVRHVYIIGGTGNGKTTMMLYSIVQDIKAGKGVAVVDPHGDLSKAVLEQIPEHRIKDVIYFDPDDIDYPISLNLLELPAGLDGSDLEREKDRITESVISVFRKIFSDDDSGGHRIEYILRNTIQTALTLADPTIFTVFELLTNDGYRKKVTAQLPAGTLKNFWKNELGKAGNMQRIKMAQGVTSKIGRFEFSVATKRVMGNPKSSIDFDDILNSQKILICNFSKGRLGEDTSALFGTAILAKLQVATNRRDKIDQAQRTPFYLYVDEFQNFATMPFVQMLSEARKYKLFLTMAEQSTAQQEEQRMVNIILANVGTVVCFRTGSPLDENLIFPLFQPFIEAGEIANLPSYSFYIRIAALQPQEPMSGQTLLLENKGSQRVSEQVKIMSRRLYATRQKDVSSKTIKQSMPKPQSNEEKSATENDQTIEA